MKTKTKTKKLSAPTAEGLGGVVRRAAMLLLAVMMTTTATWADDVNYIDADGSSKSHDATALAGSETEWTGWYVADGTVEITGRVTASGEAHLILKDGATLTIPKGITVTEGNSLTIYGQSGGTGQLTIASPDQGYAGIGAYVISSGNATKTGTITINGGTITVDGPSGTGSGGAAIGGVYWGNTGTITINGGNVTAAAHRYGAGIGCGHDASSGGTITINGGVVNATCTTGGAGIGGATNAFTPNIYILGGNVTSTGYHAGIGAGVGSNANIITISGGIVTTTGGTRCAGIGGAAATGLGTYPGNCGMVTISGGTITATGGHGGPGIGGGGAYGTNSPGANGGTIIITGGNVTAHGTHHDTYGDGYGIGHGYPGNSTNLTADIRIDYSSVGTSLTVEGYKGAVTVADGKTFTSDGSNSYSGVLTDDDKTAIANKTIVPKSVTLTANRATTASTDYWATFYCGANNYATDAATTVYKGTVSGSSLVLTEVEDGIVTAGTAVVLKSTSASPVVTYSATASANSDANDLKGGSTVAAGYDAYTLAANGGVVGFYKFTGAALDANKAHLEIAQTSPAPARGFIGFGEDGTTSLREVKNEEVKSEKFDAGAWYSLDGRRLNGQPTQKGVYVNSGRKVVIK